MALVACDDIHLTQLYRPPVTAIRRDLNLLGKTGCPTYCCRAFRIRETGPIASSNYDAARDSRVIELSLRCVIRKWMTSGFLVTCFGIIY